MAGGGRFVCLFVCFKNELCFDLLLHIAYKQTWQLNHRFSERNHGLAEVTAKAALESHSCKGMQH